MAFTVDPEVAAALEPMAVAMADMVPPPVGDVRSRRPLIEAVMARTAAAQPMPVDVKVTDFQTTTTDGAQVLLRWYVKDGAPPGPAALYTHGGGMIAGSVALYDGPVSRYVSNSGVPMLAVDYRLAPEHPHPTPVEDCYAGLQWLAEHASELGVDPGRIAVMGDSAGGGLAAALTLLARDRGGPAVSQQILIFPMLDDRNTRPDREIALSRCGATTTTSPVGAHCWAALSAAQTCRPTPPQLAPPTCPAYPPAISRSVSSISSATRTSPTPSVSASPACPLSSTSAPACRTSSRPSPMPPTSPGVPSQTASACWSRSSTPSRARQTKSQNKEQQ
jgi:acetyl esterase/lipase